MNNKQLEEMAGLVADVLDADAPWRHWVRIQSPQWGSCQYVSLHEANDRLKEYRKRVSSRDVEIEHLLAKIRDLESAARPFVALQARADIPGHTIEFNFFGMYSQEIKALEAALTRQSEVTE